MYLYEKSKRIIKNSEFYICRDDKDKYLGIEGTEADTGLFDGIITTVEGRKVKLCPLTVKNSIALRGLFPFTSPVRNPGTAASIGLGDRLGIASGGHLRLVSDHDVFPVLAQQSIRELNLTGRTYADVLAAAVFAVFQEGYEGGYGADGDHLKTAKEVEYALDNGYTMITLDCSEHIVNDLSRLDEKYAKLDDKIKTEAEKNYLGRKFTLKSGDEISFDSMALKKAVVMYKKAIDHTEYIYTDVLKKRNADVDFEVSIDETLSTTSPQDHFYVANELIKRGIEFTSLAPRFCGEFQKGIDYIGSIDDFISEFSIHARISQSFGYKISVHSGSDKFSIFPYVGKYTGMRFHVKTAGTNWLEAVKIIAMHDPVLYRKIHAFALASFDEACKYYHVGAKKENIPDISKMADQDLPGLFKHNDTRQLIHITYGLILQKSGYRDEFFKKLFEYENEYYQELIKHIGRHLTELGF